MKDMGIFFTREGLGQVGLTMGKRVVAGTSGGGVSGIGRGLLQNTVVQSIEL